MKPLVLTHSPEIADILNKASHKLGDDADLDILLERIGDSRYVLLGEASHGTHEYYTWRSRISKRLITEKNFSVIAVEGDWPDCYLVNRYVKSYKDSGANAKEVLHAFDRWPTWMWANWEIVALAEWMRIHNSKLPANKKVGFYGLDVYSLWESMEAIISYLEKTDPVALEAAKKAMECFEPYNVREGFSYADRSYGLSDTCRNEVRDLLTKIRQRMPEYDGDYEGAFSAEQNAVIAVNAEEYYKVMLRGGDSSWNIRDRHMTETVNRLMKFHGPDARIIIWEHNTHIGDARATDMKRHGLVNVGQLLKEEHDSEGVFRVGFGSYEGTVMAGYHWGGAMKKMQVPAAQPGSWEHLLHTNGNHDQVLFSRDLQDLKSAIDHRAIGVVYDPAFEYGNYVPSFIPKRYEAFIYLDQTSALHSLHIKPNGQQMPETYPWGV